MSSNQTLPPAGATGVLVPPERTAIFPKESAAALLQAACYYSPPGFTGYWTPAPKDLEGVEAGLEKFLTQQGRTRHDSWADYYRQVAGLLKEDAQFLFISYFVPEHPPRFDGQAADKDSQDVADHWRREAYWINDGGDIYFRVIFDLQKKTFVWYERNSDP
jgi:hypothetical protein